jgi:hypothetical protein
MRADLDGHRGSSLGGGVEVGGLADFAKGGAGVESRLGKGGVSPERDKLQPLSESGEVAKGCIALVGPFNGELAIARFQFAHRSYLGHQLSHPSTGSLDFSAPTNLAPVAIAHGFPLAVPGDK